MATDVIWSSCHGWNTYANYPAGTISPPHDPSWSDPEVGIYTTIFFVSLTCDRVSWGSFERPITMLLEFHNFQQTPESCFPEQTGGVVTFHTLASLWVNDTELAKALALAYDLPTFYSPIQHTSSSMGSIEEHTTTWGNLSNEIRVRDPQLEPSSDVFRARIFWYNATAVTSLDFVLDYTSNTRGPALVGIGPTPVDGELSPPMQHAYVAEQYVGQGAWYDDMEATASITRYADHFCAIG